MGLAEIYAMPTLMFFAYNQAPPSMRTLSAVTSLFMMGITSALFSVVILLFDEFSAFVPDDLNQGRLEYGYYANLVLACVFFVVFFVAKAFFREKTYSDA